MENLDPEILEELSMILLPLELESPNFFLSNMFSVHRLLMNSISLKKFMETSKLLAMIR